MLAMTWPCAVVTRQCSIARRPDVERNSHAAIAASHLPVTTSRELEGRRHECDDTWHDRVQTLPSSVVRSHAFDITSHLAVPTWRMPDGRSYHTSAASFIEVVACQSYVAREQ